MKLNFKTSFAKTGVAFRCLRFQLIGTVDEARYVNQLFVRNGRCYLICTPTRCTVATRWSRRQHRRNQSPTRGAVAPPPYKQTSTTTRRTVVPRWSRRYHRRHHQRAAQLRLWPTNIDTDTTYFYASLVPTPLPTPSRRRCAVMPPPDEHRHRHDVQLRLASPDAITHAWRSCASASLSRLPLFRHPCGAVPPTSESSPVLLSMPANLGNVAFSIFSGQPPRRHPVFRLPPFSELLPSPCFPANHLVLNRSWFSRPYHLRVVTPSASTWQPWNRHLLSVFPPNASSSPVWVCPASVDFVILC